VGAIRGTGKRYTLKAPNLKIVDAERDDSAGLSNSPDVSQSELAKALDRPGTIVPGDRNDSSGVVRNNSSGDVGTIVPTNNTLEKQSCKEHEEKNTRPPLTPQGGNAGGRSSSHEQELEETAQNLLNHFTTTYADNLDVPYMLRKGRKDLNEFVDLLQQYHPNDIRSCIDEFIADDDWTLIKKKTVGMFRARINTYMQPDPFGD
jgi:hypothetical protein